jgi:enoyl-[acyl-carrier protein] reductase II
MNPNAPEVAKVVIEEGVQVVTTGAGNPARFMKDFKDAGIRVIPVVASVAMAKLMERSGADAVVAEGMESGGHIGSATTMTLVPQVVDALSIPVIAAGGIGDGRGVAAAFMLGAQAVQMGTRFIVAKESIVHQNYKDKVIHAKDIDSEVTGMSTGHPVRQIRNQMTREYLKLEKNGAGLEELEYLTLGALRKAVIEGDTVNGTLMAGQIAGLVKKEQSCSEIIQELMQEADALLGKEW